MERNYNNHACEQASDPQQPSQYVYLHQDPYQPQIRTTDIPGMQSMIDSAFKKGLASCILAGFPIASIIGIFLGCKSKKQVSQIDCMATKYGDKIRGKRTAAKVLGNIGFGLSIGMTVFWAFYIFVVVLAAINALNSYYYY